MWSALAAQPTLAVSVEILPEPNIPAMQLFAREVAHPRLTAGVLSRGPNVGHPPFSEVTRLSLLLFPYASLAERTL